MIPFKRFFGCILLFAVCSYGYTEPTQFSTQSLEAAMALQKKAQVNDLAYNITRSLTTEVGSRLAGSKGDEQAVDWAVKQFKALGFDKVWTEPVVFPFWQRGLSEARIISPFPRELAITALGRSQATQAQGIEGEVAHFLTYADLQNAPRAQVEGKIVFISNRMRRTKDGSGYGEAVIARSQGAIEAAKKGAIALVIRSIGTDNNRTPHTGMMRYDDQVAKIPAAAIANPDADLLVRQLGYDQAVRLFLKLTPTLAKTAKSNNVIAEMTGRSKPDELVILGAHLDSWDLGEGAIDDGAGVGIVMAAGHLIGTAPRRPQRTIRVILFANEESGLVGAYKYAFTHQDTLNKHIIGAESDFGAGRIFQLSSRVKPSAVPVIQQIANALAPLGIEWGDNKARGGPDLIPLKDSGMAVVTLQQDGTDYFDYHHTANDTLDKIDPKAMAQNLAAYVTFGYLAADAPGDFGFQIPKD